MPLLRLSGLVKRFGSTAALDGASLEIERGEVHALVGENGAGKSTLLAIVAGALDPDAGEMRLSDRPYRPRSPREARRAGVALVHQELSLFPHLTVWENILIGIEVHHRGWLDLWRNRNRAREALALLGHADLDPDRCVGDLSIGARQVVEICRALAADARIVLLDEPTSSLPRDDVERLFAVVRRLAASGVGVVYISHALEEVRAVAARVTVLRDGRAVASGPLTVLSDDQIVAHMAGRSLERFFPSRERRVTGDLALSVRGLSAPPRVVSASFDLRRGEILGIAGLVGSGRSTLVRALYGLVRPAGGKIELGGRPAPLVTTPGTSIGRGVGYLSEDRREEGLAAGLSVADNVTLTDYSPCARGGWIDLARQTSGSRAALERVGARVRDISRPVRVLSGGNQQKVALARLLHQRASVLLLDEPTRGIDVASKAQIYATIAALAAEGCAVLLVSSYLPELFGLCDRLAVMRRGQLLPARPVAEWTEHEVLEQALGVGTAGAGGEAAS